MTIQRMISKTEGNCLKITRTDSFVLKNELSVLMISHELLRVVMYFVSIFVEMRLRLCISLFVLMPICLLCHNVSGRCYEQGLQALPLMQLGLFSPLQYSPYMQSLPRVSAAQPH